MKTKIALAVASLAVAFAAGVGCGVRWKPEAMAPSRCVATAGTSCPCVATAPSPSQDEVMNIPIRDGGGAVATQDDGGGGVATQDDGGGGVAMQDDGGGSAEIAAAHALRRERRRAAREARSRERQDFLSALNLELLSDEQRERHALYMEAMQRREEAWKEIASLRTEGKEVPEDVQARLSEAETVLRADRESERHALRGAAARAAGLDEAAIRQLTEDLATIDRNLQFAP